MLVQYLLPSSFRIKSTVIHNLCILYSFTLNVCAYLIFWNFRLFAIAAVVRYAKFECMSLSVSILHIHLQCICEMVSKRNMKQFPIRVENPCLKSIINFHIKQHAQNTHQGPEARFVFVCDACTPTNQYTQPISQPTIQPSSHPTNQPATIQIKRKQNKNL